MWKSRATYLYVLIFSLVLLLFYDDKNVGFTIFYALVFLLALAVTSIVLARRLIFVDEAIERDTIFKGEKLLYKAKIKNKGIFYYPRAEVSVCSAGAVLYSGEENAHEIKAAVLSPKKSIQINYGIDFPYRGYYDIGIESINVNDFLGLFNIRFKNKNTLKVCVYPQCIRDFVLPVNTGPFDVALSMFALNADHTEISDMRKYTPSDSIRNIHWKLSAKRSELMVKNFQAYEQGGMVVYVDSGAAPAKNTGKLDFEDKIASYAASAVEYCIKCGMRTQLICADKSITVQPHGNINEAFEELARLDFGGKAGSHPLPEIAGEYNLVLVLSHLDAEIYALADELIFNSREAALYFLTEAPLENEDKSILKNIQEQGVFVQIVYVTQGTALQDGEADD